MKPGITTIMWTFLENTGLPILEGIVALLLIFSVLLDTFEVIILPRRVVRPLRLATIIYRFTWIPWAARAEHIKNPMRRENFLAFYGPLALIFLLLIWLVGLIFGFALLQQAFGSQISVPGGKPSFGTDLYMSGTTLLTLGLGDVVPQSGIARAITVIEVGTGFGVLAMVIGYLPVLYQAFSRREVNISLLDARAGSPPTAVELLRRHGHLNGEDHNIESLNQLLYEWERWSAELLESHLSYPSLAYFRSQHDNQSWLAALTMILDACALVLVGIDDVPIHQAKLTFAMARHAIVDLGQVFDVPYRTCKANRLQSGEFERMRAILAKVGMAVRGGEEAETKLKHYREMYEPYVNALSKRLLIAVPPWFPPTEEIRDDWQTSA